MNNKVYVIADCSASFIEDGKAAIQRYLLTTVMSAVMKLPYDEEDFFYLVWNDDIAEIDPISCHTDCDLRISFGGKASMHVLYNAVKQIGENGRILLLSDGCYDSGDMKEITRIKRLAEKLNTIIYVVAVGADADEYGLSEIATVTKKVFNASDILLAVRDLYLRSFLPNTSGPLKKRRIW